MMEAPYSKYETVIGLEIHIQLKTKSKAYCRDDASYGGAPNTQISPVSLGHPGTLPTLNKEQVNHAIRLGLAIGSNIRLENQFARKNYFYADLPKGYQITQDTTPICTGGAVNIVSGENQKTINITRIHMEEDAGKSMHDLDPYNSLIDLNRAGVPLLELVSEPEMRSSDEAYSFITEVRKLVRYLDVSDGNMEEGSMRVDCNISVRPWGQEKFGDRCEVKNINSIRNAKRAIEFEVKRQIDLIESGGLVEQQTRNFDPSSGTTSLLRSKEDAHDYRYFPEPDLPPLVLTENQIEAIRANMPPLPQELLLRFQEEFGLNLYDAQVLTDDKETALFFLAMASKTTHHKTAANVLINQVRAHLNERAISLDKFPLDSTKLTEYVELLESGKVSVSTAHQRIFPALVDSPEKTAEQLAEELNLLQSSDDDFLEGLIQAALEKYPDKVEAYRNGNKNLLGLFMGEVMKASKGKADPKATSALLTKALQG